MGWKLRRSIKCDTSRLCLSFRGGIVPWCEMSRVRLIFVALLFCCAIRAEAKDDNCISSLTIDPQILTSPG